MDEKKVVKDSDDISKKKITLRPKKNDTDSQIKTENGLLYVSRHYNGEEESEDASESIIEIKDFETTPARVNLKYGLTMNMGNYESVRVDVGIDIPCYVEEIDAAYKKAQEFVIEKINQEKNEVRGEDEFDDTDISSSEAFSVEE